MSARTRLAAVLMAATVAMAPLQAMACEVAGLSFSDRDLTRLENLTTSRTIGLGAALKAEDGAARYAVAGIFASGFAAPGTELVVGKYQCRTIKLGGALSLIAYQWFQCEIGQEEGTYTLRKVTGSQNFFGLLTPTEGGFTYRGAAHYGYEPEVRFYGADPERDQVGCLNKLNAEGSHLVLELPMPLVESDHDLIELTAIAR